MSALLTVLLISSAMLGDVTLTVGSTQEPECRESSLGRRLVFANFYGTNWGVLSGIPSGEVTLFLGSSLRTRSDRWGHKWQTAIGYEISGAAGGADYFTASYSWGGDYGVAYHRHHLAALGYGAKDDRLYYHMGGGLLMWRTAPLALEADARLGVILGVKQKRRLRGVVGAQVRIVGIIGGVALPQFGLFAGLLVF